MVKYWCAERTVQYDELGENRINGVCYLVCYDGYIGISLWGSIWAGKNNSIMRLMGWSIIRTGSKLWKKSIMRKCIMLVLGSTSIPRFDP